MDVVSPIGFAGISGSLVAGEALAKCDLVAIKDADGEVYKADVSDATLRPCIGIVDKAYDDGDYVTVLPIATVEGCTGLTAGHAVYLSTTGDFTCTRPGGGYCQSVGFAWSNTIAFIMVTQAYA
jgi:hypothetical protein